jgi:ribosome silencing factor RsfS/YbeB/iojap
MARKTDDTRTPPKPRKAADKPAKPRAKAGSAPAAGPKSVRTAEPATRSSAKPARSVATAPGRAKGTVRSDAGPASARAPAIRREAEEAPARRPSARSGKDAAARKPAGATARGAARPAAREDKGSGARGATPSAARGAGVSSTSRSTKAPAPRGAKAPAVRGGDASRAEAPAARRVPAARNARDSLDAETPRAPRRSTPGQAAGATRKPLATRGRPADGRPLDAAPPRLSTTARLRAAPRAPEEGNTRALAAAGPTTPRKPRGPRAQPKLDPDRLQRLVDAAVASLEADKAEDVTVLDVTGRSSFTDRMVIATGLADRQIQAMATHLDEALAKEGLKLNRNAIQGSDDWVLIDCGDLVIHLFKPEARLTYDLEKMWGPDSPMGEPGPGEVSPI